MRYMLIHAGDPDLASEWDDEAQASFSSGIEETIRSGGQPAGEPPAADWVRGHVLICMLACYLTWHLRSALAKLTFTDQDIPVPADPVLPAQRSRAAEGQGRRQAQQ